MHAVRRIAPLCLVAALVVGLPGNVANAASAPILIYGTTAPSTSGSTYTAGTIGSGTTVRLDDGATISGASPIVVNGTFQYNQTTGTLTISNTVSNAGTLSVLNTGMLRLTGTDASGIVSLNNTINVSAGQLAIGGGVSGTVVRLLFGTSGTATMNVSGGMVTSGSDMAFGFGNGSLATVNLSSGTIQPGYRIYIGGTASFSGEALVSPANGNATVNVTGGLFGGGIQNVLVIASGSTSQATVNVSNGGVLGGNATAYVGISGTGAVTVDNGGAFYGNQTFVGYRANSSGTLTVNAGGTASFGSVLTLCQGTGTAIGATPGGSHGTVTVASGGYLQARGLSLVETSTNVANGIIVGRSGTAVMTISGTVLANGVGGGSQTAGSVTVGNGPVGSGTATLTINSGGYLVAPARSIAAPVASST